MPDETLPPCPRADCDASPEDAPHHFHGWLGDTLTHQGRNSACITGGPGLSSRCYSAHVPNVSESPTGSPVDPTPVAARAGGFRDKLAGAAIPIVYQPVCGHCLGERNASVPYPCPTRRAAEGDE